MFDQCVVSFSLNTSAADKCHNSHSLQMVRPTVAARKAMVQTPLQQDETLSAYDMAQYNDRLLQFVLLA